MSLHPIISYLSLLFLSGLKFLERSVYEPRPQNFILTFLQTLSLLFVPFYYEENMVLVSLSPMHFWVIYFC
jgi:hypothetical protein